MLKGLYFRLVLSGNSQINVIRKSLSSINGDGNRTSRVSNGFHIGPLWLMQARHVPSSYTVNVPNHAGVTVNAAGQVSVARHCAIVRVDV